MRTPREAAVFVHRSGRFLLMRRAIEGYWHVVAGVVEPHESYLEAAERELLEETGLTASGPLLDLGLRQPHGIPDDLRHEYPPDTTEVVIESFAVEAPAEWEPVLNAEHVEHRWCTVAEALALLHWPAAGEVLRVLSSRLRPSQRPGDHTST